MSFDPNNPNRLSTLSHAGHPAYSIDTMSSIAKRSISPAGQRRGVVAGLDWAIDTNSAQPQTRKTKTMQTITEVCLMHAAIGEALCVDSL